MLAALTQDCVKAGGMDVVSDLRLGWDSKYAQKFRFQVSRVINSHFGVAALCI